MADTPLAPVVRYIHQLVGRPEVADPTDADLLRQFVHQRDEDAFATLVRRHGPLVWRVCRRLLRHTHHAEEAYQATFLVLARQAAKVRKPASLASFLYGVAYRIARKTRADIVRRQSHEKESIVLPVVDPACEAAWRELEEIVVEEVHALAEKYRLPILLCYWQGLTNEEAAVRLGWPAGTVKTRLLKARRLLHERLTQRGVSLSAGVFATLLAAGGGEAAVPLDLASSAMRMGMAFLRGDSLPAAGATALAEQAVQGVALSKVHIVLVLLLASGIATAVGALAHHEAPARQAEEARAARPNRKAKEAEKPKIRTDHYGDPLPPGAVARLGTVRFRHPFWVSGLAFSSDGKALASACWDGNVRLWDAATGKETHCFRGRLDPMSRRGREAFLGMALSPDAKTLIALGNQGTVYDWNMATNKELRCLKGTSGFGLALSPDGKILAVGQGGDKAKRQFALWDLTTGKQRRELGAAARPVQALAFSPDSKVLAAGDCAAVGAAKAEDGVSTIRLWDAAIGRQLRELKGHTGGVTAVTFSPDGRVLLSASHDTTLRFWDPVTGKQVRKIQVPDSTGLRLTDTPNVPKGVNYGGVLTVAYCPDGRLLATGSYDGTVRLWDANSGKELHALHGHGREVASVVFSPDGKILASGSRDHTIRLWDPASGKQLQARQGQDGPVRNLAISPDGRIVAVVCEDHTIRLWSVATERQMRVLRGHTDFVYAVAFSSDGRTVASGSADRTVRLWDAATGRELRRLPEHQSAVYSLAFTPVRNMLISGEANGTLHFWDQTTGEELRQLPGFASSHFLQLSTDGKILATATANAVHLLDVNTGKELRRFGGSWPRFALSPDGRTLAIQVSGEKIRLWSVPTGEELGVLADQDSPPGYIGVVSYVFSPDGRLLARVGKGDLELWEVLTGKLRRRFRGHQAGIGPFAFSLDGKTILSGSNDTTVLIWDVARQQEERPSRLSAAELDGLWRALADDDVEKADRAICTLAARAEQSLPFLERHLRPAKIAEAERLARLIADLDSDQFAVRDRATHELERLGERAETALRQALKKTPTLEMRRRVEALLAPLRGLPPVPELLRALRAVEVLERIGTPEAQHLLEKLVRGAPEARLTREAKASLERLAKRRSAKP